VAALSDRGYWAPVASQHGRTAAATRPGYTDGTEQREGRSHPERERERERGREVQLTDGNSAARGQLGLDGVGGTGRGRRGIEAAA
jgi:hypothetical protein